MFLQEEETDPDKQGAPCEEGGRGRGGTAGSQGAGSPLEVAGKDPPLEPSER